MLFAGVVKVCVFRHREFISKSSNVFDLGMFSRTPEMLCFTMQFHDFVNALVKKMMWKLECLCVLSLQYLQWFKALWANKCFNQNMLSLYSWIISYTNSKYCYWSWVHFWRYWINSRYVKSYFWPRFLHRGLRNDFCFHVTSTLFLFSLDFYFSFLFELLFPFSIWTFISFFSLDFYSF